MRCMISTSRLSRGFRQPPMLRKCVDKRGAELRGGTPRSPLSHGSCACALPTSLVPGSQAPQRPRTARTVPTLHVPCHSSVHLPLCTHDTDASTCGVRSRSLARAPRLTPACNWHAQPGSLHRHPLPIQPQPPPQDLSARVCAPSPSPVQPQPAPRALSKIVSRVNETGKFSR